MLVFFCYSLLLLQIKRNIWKLYFKHWRALTVLQDICLLRSKYKVHYIKKQYTPDGTFKLASMDSKGNEVLHKGMFFQSECCKRRVLVKNLAHVADIIFGNNNFSSVCLRSKPLFAQTTLRHLSALESDYNHQWLSDVLWWTRREFSHITPAFAVASHVVFVFIFQEEKVILEATHIRPAANVVSAFQDPSKALTSWAFLFKPRSRKANGGREMCGLWMSEMRASVIKVDFYPLNVHFVRPFSVISVQIFRGARLY